MRTLVLVRHAEPLVVDGIAAAQWTLSDRGRADAATLGALLADRWQPEVVWVSAERKALETANLAFPSAPIRVRPELAEVTRPWYPTPGALADAVAAYLQGATVAEWEPRDAVVDRLTTLEGALDGPEAVPHGTERAAIVSHGVLLTALIDHAIGLEDAFGFWSNLRLPDAWELDVETRSVARIVS